jgi:hypothetical protein
MQAAEAQIKERLPVWEALSEFFLDTELQPDDYARIAKLLAASAYSEKQIEQILVDEVCPVCRLNLLTVAGEWIGFDRQWLGDTIGGRLGKKPRFRWFFVLRHRWMYGRHWNKVRPMIVALRGKQAPV